MMKLALVLLAVLVSVPALAYKDGVYACKNGDTRLPDNTYKFETVNLGGISLPVVDINRYYRQETGNPNSAMQRVNVKGVATLTSTEAGYTTVMLNNVRLEFKGDEFLNCKK